MTRTGVLDSTAAPTWKAQALPCPFVMLSDHEAIVAADIGRVLSPHPGRGLSASVQAFFEEATPTSHPATPILVGAIPFKSSQPAHLVQPRRLLRWEGRSSSANALSWLRTADAARAPRQWSIVAEPPVETYAAYVRQALSLIERDQSLRKVVLARTLLAHADRPIDPVEVLRCLSTDPHATTFAVALPPTTGVPRTIVGATPELLVSKTGDTVLSVPLAGSARRSVGAADRDAAEALIRSDKNRREHAMVVEWISDQLAPYCADLDVPAVPDLVSTRTMWHLGTRITGRLRDAHTSSLELALALHPTPAVSGLPQPLAASAIDTLEPFDRGFFGGAVGWCDAAGDGRWFVAIRCAEIAGATARLYAGAGIVAGSQPEAEAAETAAKFQTLLAALDIEAERV